MKRKIAKTKFDPNAVAGSCILQANCPLITSDDAVKCLSS